MTEQPRDLRALASALGRLTRLLSNRRIHGRLTSALGIELSQQAMQVLGALDRGNPLPVGEVARTAHMDVGAVSRQLRALDERGLVEREVSPGNASVVLVTLTDAGETVARQVADMRARHLDEALTGWTADELSAVSEQLGRLLDDLQATPYRAG